MSKIIFMGTPDFSTKVLEMLIAEHEVIAVARSVNGIPSN
jgi:methionyl-tRNA formyltransferase